jgi:lipopolysaccharide export system protein LptC
MSDAAVASLKARAAAARPGGGYDRFVALAKRALPLAAVVVLAACLIWPLTATQDFSFVLSKDRVAAAGERLRIDRALYKGEDSKGQPFEISAAKAVQRTSATPVVELTDIAAKLQTAEGLSQATAEMGRYDLTRERIDIVGPVRFDTEEGTKLATRDVSVDLPTRMVASDAPISGQVPLGTFTANRLRADVRGRVVVLDGGVKLRITQRVGR